MKQRIIRADANDGVTPRQRENRELARAAAREGIVLLKNDGALPVKPGRIALYGAGASRTFKGGTGSGEVNERHTVTILEGLELAGYEIASYGWIRDFEAECREAEECWRQERGAQGAGLMNSMVQPFMPPAGRVITDADIAASACDTAIYVVARQAGEGADKKLKNGEFDLSPAETESILKMAAGYKNSVLVINSGSYMDIGTLDEAVSAVVWFCQQGMEGGAALADILSGRASPSGKLTDTWARRYADVPCAMQYSYLNGDTTHEYYREGIYVGYRYYDSFETARRYPFGFGLSYTRFALNTESVTLENGAVNVAVRVKNTGTVRGKEVVQVYASAPQGELTKEYQRLAGFKKSRALAPGEEETLNVSFPLDYMASYSERRAAYILEKGEYIVRVGASSADTVPVAVITLDGTAELWKLRNVCPVKAEFSEIAPAIRRSADDLSAAARLELRAADIGCRTVDYSEPPVCRDADVQEALAKLSTGDMIDLCVGTGVSGMFSTAYNYTPGAVGRTTDKFADKGITNVNLADGPAGLRLLRVSALNKHGRLRFCGGEYINDIMRDLPPRIREYFDAAPEDETLYQHATAFPVGTALAQSWNTELCERVGAAVAREMEEYGVTYWLAPAMNIHRNPLCGRNFEYLSEDPVLTGKLAAAITRGVQSVDGCYATVKHFACNNLEDNRNHSDSIVHERALREIYLKGFEICVREAQPKALMTSYNLLNGVYTADSHDLCTAILRNEWGFDGVVMTDWYSTLPGLADAGSAIGAGNDMIMPGTPLDKLAIRRGLSKFRLTDTDLKRSAARIIRSVLRSNVNKPQE